MDIKSIKLVSILWFGALAGAGCAFIAQVILARSLGVEEYGAFIAAMMVVAVLTPVAVFGIPQFWLRVFGQERAGAVRWLAPSLRFFIFSASFVWVLFILWALFGPHDSLMMDILLVLSFCFLGQSAVELLIGKCQIVEDYYGVFLWQLLPPVLRLLYVLFLAFFLSEGMGLINIAWGYSVVSLGFLIAAFYLFRNVVLLKSDLNEVGSEGGGSVLNL